MKMAGEMKVRLCGTFPISNTIQFPHECQRDDCVKGEGQGVRDKLVEEETGLMALGQTF